MIYQLQILSSPKGKNLPNFHHQVVSQTNSFEAAIDEYQHKIYFPARCFHAALGDQVIKHNCSTSLQENVFSSRSVHFKFKMPIKVITNLDEFTLYSF